MTPNAATKRGSKLFAGSLVYPIGVNFPLLKRVHIYRPKMETKVSENPKEVSGEPLLKSFVLNLQEIWD